MCHSRLSLAVMDQEEERSSLFSFLNICEATERKVERDPTRNAGAEQRHGVSELIAVLKTRRHNSNISHFAFSDDNIV